MAERWVGAQHGEATDDGESGTNGGQGYPEAGASPPATAAVIPAVWRAGLLQGVFLLPAT